MAADQLGVGNLVHETSITTGTGNQTLVAVNGKRTFNTEFGTGGTDVFDYFISNPDAAEWEIGTGHMSTSTVLVRDTVIQSSNSDSAVSFTAGEKNITNDLPATLQGGAWDLLETVVASADATIDIINLSSKHFAFKFVWSDIQPANNDVDLWMRTDANNGASFDAGASDYQWTVHRITMETSPTHAVVADGADSEMHMGATVFGNAANEFANFEIILFDPSATSFTKFVWAGTRVNASAIRDQSQAGCMRNSAALVDAVRFLFSAGNISVGTLKIYGLRA